MSRKGSAAASAGGDAPTFDVKGYDFGSVELAPMRSNATKPFVVLVLASNEVRDTLSFGSSCTEGHLHLLLSAGTRCYSRTARSKAVRRLQRALAHRHQES